MDDNEEIVLTRRKVIQNGTIAAGGLLLGVSATSPVGAKQKPGSAFAPLGSGIQKGDTFIIASDEGFTVELSPSCKEGAQSKEYQVFEVSGLPDSHIAVNPNRGVEPGPTRYEVTSVKKDCDFVAEGGIKFAYKPA